MTFANDRSGRRRQPTTAPDAERTRYAPAGSTIADRQTTDRTARIRITGLPAAVRLADTRGIATGQIRRFWAYADDGAIGTTGPAMVLQGPNQGGANASADTVSVVESGPSDAFQNNPDGTIVLRVRPGQRNVYATYGEVADADNLPLVTADTHNLPPSMRFFTIYARGGETVTLDASEFYSTLFPAPTVAAVDRGLLAMAGVPEGWTIWLAAPLATSDGYAREGGFVHVSRSYGPDISQAMASVKVGRWNVDPAAPQIQLRSADGSVRVNYVGEVTIGAGATTVVNAAPAVAAAGPGAIAAGAGFEILARTMPPFWTMLVDDVPVTRYDTTAHTASGRYAIGPHVVRFVLGIRPEIVVPPQTVTLVDRDVTIDGGRAISVASLAARLAGRTDEADAIDTTIRGNLPAPARAPSSAGNVRIIRMPHRGAVFTGSTRTPDSASRWEDSALTRWLVPLAPGAQRVTVATEGGERRYADVTVASGATVDLTWDAMTPETVDVSVVGARSGSIAVVPANPVGWRVDLDGSKDAPTTAHALAAVPPGRHRVTLTRVEDGAVLARTVTVEEGKEAIADFSADLSGDAFGPPAQQPPATTGAVAVLPDSVANPAPWIAAGGPWAVAVDVLDRPVDLRAVPAGNHRVYVTRASDQLRFARDVTVVAGGTATADFTADLARLAPPATGPGSITVVPASYPAGWSVAVDEGRVPDLRAVPPGIHRVTFSRAADNRVLFRDVNLQPGQALTVDFTAELGQMAAAEGWSGVGAIALANVPDAWAVMLDGVQTADRAALRTVSPGPHNVGVRSGATGRVLTQRADVVNGQQVTLDFGPNIAADSANSGPAATGSVVARGVSAGDALWIDDAEVPVPSSTAGSVTIPSVAPGSRILRLRRHWAPAPSPNPPPQPPDVLRTALVFANAQASVDFADAPSTTGPVGSIQLINVPQGSRVFLDRRLVGVWTTDFVGKTLPAATEVQNALASVPVGRRNVGIIVPPPNTLSLASFIGTAVAQSRSVLDSPTLRDVPVADAMTAERGVDVTAGGVARADFAPATVAADPAMGAVDVRGVPAPQGAAELRDAWSVKLDNVLLFDRSRVAPGAHALTLWLRRYEPGVRYIVAPPEELVASRGFDAVAGTVSVVDFTADVRQAEAADAAERTSTVLPVSATPGGGGPLLRAINERRYPAAQRLALKIGSIAPDGRVVARLSTEAAALVGTLLSPGAQLNDYAELDPIPTPDGRRVVAVYARGRGMIPAVLDGTANTLLGLQRGMYRVIGLSGAFLKDHPVPPAV